MAADVEGVEGATANPSRIRPIGESITSFDLFAEPDPHTVTEDSLQEGRVRDGFAVDKRKPAEFEGTLPGQVITATNPGGVSGGIGKVARDRQVAGEHYKEAGLQPWDVIDAYGLDFYRGNALKYLLRAGRKDGVPALDDLRKCAHYLERIIEIEEGKS